MKLKQTKNVKTFILAGAITSLVTVGCTETNVDGDSTTKQDNKQQVDQLDPSGKQTRLEKIGKKVFSIPSPLQLSMLIKETEAEYDQTLLHDIANVDGYLDETKMALNLGVYGADLGYTSIYNNATDAIGYYKAIQNLTDKLEIAEAFDTRLAEKISGHLQNNQKDSLLTTISDSYRNVDIFLKDNKRQHVGALILTGGWVESLYFATTVNQIEKNEKVRGRIGEQKKALDNILNILVKYYNKPGVSEIYDEMEKMYDIFDQVQITYEYEKPEVDVENRHTTIKSKTKVEFSEETYKAICEKIKELRALVTK